MRFKKNLLISFCLLLGFATMAQKDSLVLKNGNVIVGEIKSLDKGVLTIKTAYSKNDFTIEWGGIKEIFSKSQFLVTLTNGKRINGTFESVEGGNKIVITDISGGKTETTFEGMVYLKGLKSDFWSRAYASIDLGLSLTKANNLQQYNVRSKFGYLADKWQFDLFYDDTRSKQDSVAETKRTEGGIAAKYFLQKDWYLAASLNFLSNTEQALDLRTTGKLGAGKYIVHTNKQYWGLGAGLSFNNESFTNGTTSRSSLEGYFGSELNFFDIGDLSLLSNIWVYPSFTENGRWRTDFIFDAKYDLPLDFYIKLGFTLNYDNRPAVKGKETDYVLAFSIGWEL
jgi:small nuclear ribonucleoprotein (snRNP)-like protein